MFYNKYTKIKEAYGKNHHKKYVFILTKKHNTVWNNFKTKHQNRRTRHIRYP